MVPVDQLIMQLGLDVNQHPLVPGYHTDGRWRLLTQGATVKDEAQTH